MFKGKSKKNKAVSILLLTGLFLGIMNQPIVSEAVTPERPSWTFDFKGTKEEFTVPQSGNYMIETYGAQGESSGGLGGYTKGTIRLETGNVLSINVGGQNGYNGGGSGSSSGGGATDVKIKGNTESLLVGAGGGGGSGGTNGGSDTGKGGASVGNGAGADGVNGGGGGRSYNYSYSTGYWENTGYYKREYGTYTSFFVRGSCPSPYTYHGTTIGGESWCSGTPYWDVWVDTGQRYVQTSSGTTSGISGKGGANFINSIMVNSEAKNGVQSGNGLVKITQLIAPPQLTLTKQPTKNQIYGNGDILEIEGSVKDDDDKGNIMKVMYTIDNGPVQNVMNVAKSRTDIPFVIQRDLTSELSSGSHTLRLWSTDETDDIGSEYTYNFTVKEKPTISISKDVPNNKMNVSWDFDLTNQSMTYDLYRSTDGVSFTKILSDSTSKSLSDMDGKDDSAPTNIENLDVQKIGASNYLQFSHSTDKGSSYTYYVEATRSSDNKKYRSVNVTEEIKDNTVGYSYVVDDKAGTEPDKTIDTKNNSNLIDISKFEYAQAYYIHVRAIDGKGNASETAHKRILTGKPTIDVSLSETGWTQNNITITVKADSTTSSIERIDLPDGTQIVGNTATYLVSQNGIYPFVAYDKTGTMTVEFVEINKIDRLNPTIELNSSTEWQNQDIDITVKATP